MKRKIFAAFILALLAIGLALTITHFSFREMMTTVDQLSAPNEKLTKLNKVFEEITMLDQQQRAEAIKNPLKPYKYFLDQSGFLHMMIDSLKMYPWDTAQVTRLSSLNEILDRRNQMFVSYMKVKAELADNKEFSLQLDTLSTLLLENQKSADSIVTTQRKTITRYIQQDSLKAVTKDKSFLKKLFSKKKEKVPANPQMKVKEELNVTVDTLAIAHQGVDLEDIQKRMRHLESDQRAQRKRLQNKELELIHANSLFINQLLNTLHEVENEELVHMKAGNNHAAQVVTNGISRMHMLMLGFFLAAALLVYFILLDITRSNYYKLQLEKARDHAEELSKIKQRFLANMSHEIRTPLQSIIGFAEQLKLNQNQNTDAVEAIHSSSEHLLHIVNEVLDYSRIASGHLTLAKENFSLLKVVKEVEAAMRIQSQHKKLTFILDTEKAREHQLYGDAFRLRQILYNLLGNAIKFTHKGFIKLSIRTHEEENEVRCSFEITDSGIGMTATEVEKIFNQFEQANTEINKTYGGTGLGLNIVKSLVDVQHGVLEVTSKPGMGSTFKVVLEIEKASNFEKSLSILDPGTTETTVGNVLVVDDDAMILKLCSLIMNKNKITHTSFNDPTLLLSLKPDPDVTHILIDIRMPKINGAEVCQALKPKYAAGTKFIALTAHVLPDERASLLKKGFDVVLAKPFHEAELLQVLGIYGEKELAEQHLPDFSIVRKMTMGDEALFQSVMQQFTEESGEDLRLLEGLVKVNNRKLIRETVHKLAGRFGQMGISNLSTRFHNVEVGLVDGKPLAEVSPELKDIIKEATSLLQTIKLTQPAH